MKTVLIIVIVISTLVVVGGISTGVYFGTKSSDHSRKGSKGDAPTNKPTVTKCPVCKNGGNCDGGKCQCPPGFGGTDCGLRIPPPKPMQSLIPTPTPSRIPSPSRIPTPTPSRIPSPSLIPTPTPSPSPVPAPVLCSPPCKNNTSCVDGKCKCPLDLEGDDCSSRICKTACKKGGSCNSTTGTCQCPSNYTGDDCGTELCSSPCKNNGTCKDGKCDCPSGFIGTQCEYPQCYTHLNSSGYTYDTVKNCCTDTQLTGVPANGDLACTAKLSKYGNKRFMCKVDLENSPYKWADDFKPADPSVDNKCGGSCPPGRTGQGCNDFICHQGIKINDIYIYDEDNQCCTVSLQDKDSLKPGTKVCDIAKPDGKQIMYTCVYQGDDAPKVVTIPPGTKDMLCQPGTTNSYFCPNSLNLSDTKPWNGRCCESSKDAPTPDSVKSGDTVCIVATNTDEEVVGYRPCIYHSMQVADDLTVTSLGDTDYDCAMTATADGGGSIPFCPPSVSLGDLYKKSSDKWTKSGNYLATGCCSTQKMDQSSQPKSGDIVCIEEHGTNLYPCMYDTLNKARMLKHGASGTTGDKNYVNQAFDATEDSTCNSNQDLGKHATQYPWCKTSDLYNPKNLGCYCDNTTKITPVVHQVAYEKDGKGTYLCEIPPAAGSEGDPREPKYLPPCQATQDCVCTQNTGGWWGTYSSCAPMSCGVIPGHIAYCGACTNNGTDFLSHFPPC